MAADASDLQVMLKNMRISAASTRVDRNWIKYGDLGEPFRATPTSYKQPKAIARMSGIEGYMKLPGSESRLESLKDKPGMGTEFTVAQLQPMPAKSKVPKKVPEAVATSSSSGKTADGALGEDGKWYSAQEWNAWNGANMNAAHAAANARSADRAPRVQAPADYEEEEGFQVEMDWTTPIAKVHGGIFAKLAAARVEDDAPMLAGSIPRASFSLRYGIM